ncbi:MAG: DSD1 family PLP-dependent enzyme [Dehalococcoidia bacterium]
MTTAATHEAVGRRIEELDTPALFVDLDALEANASMMAGACRANGIDWRPHVKASKAPELAKRLLAAGAVGVTCAKVSEAEVMADGGITDILIANEVVGATKIARLVALAGRARLCVAADDTRNLEELSAAATAAGVNLDVLVDVDVGMGRCGVTPEEAPALAQRVLDLPGLSLRGLMGYEGHVQGIRDLEEKEARSEESASMLAEAKRLVEAVGIPVECTSGGGTGNYWIASTLGALTELQAGGGVLMDQTYGLYGVPGHRQALFLEIQVISAPRLGQAIGDAGWKASGRHTGLPAVWDSDLAQLDSSIEVTGLSAEHTHLRLAEGVTLEPGQRLLLVPHYSDSTVLLHRTMYAVRNGVVEDVWPISGAGMLQ